jgi:hypothetical protein
MDAVVPPIDPAEQALAAAPRERAGATTPARRP